MSQWYYARGGQQKGPVAFEELRTMARSGALDPADLVWNASMKDWLPASAIAGIFTAEEPAPSREMPNNPYTTPGSAWGVTSDSYVGTPATEIVPGSEPIDVMACIGRGFQLTKRHFLVLFLVGLIYIGISMAVNLPFSIMEGVQNFNSYSPSPGEGQFAYGVRDQFTPLYLVHQIVSSLVSLFLALGTTRIGLNLVSGQEASVGQVFSQGGKMLRMIGATIIFYIAVMIGFVLLIVPGVYIALRFGQFAIAIVDKDMGIMEAFRYSSSLTTNNRLNLLGLGIMGFLIMIAGLLALCVGVVFAIPVVWLSTTVAYRWMQYGRRAIMDYPGTEVPMIKQG